MAEFLQSYGIWIFLGFLFLLMLRGHRHGMGCCGSHQHEPETVKEEEHQESGKRNSGCH